MAHTLPPKTMYISLISNEDILTKKQKLIKLSKLNKNNTLFYYYCNSNNNDYDDIYRLKT